MKYIYKITENKAELINQTKLYDEQKMRIE